MPAQRSSTHSARQRGAALLLFALLFLIAGTSILLTRTGVSGSGARTKITSSGLEQARAALLGYAATYRDTHPNEIFGFLPCPDTNNDGFAEASCGAAGDVVIGRLPHKTLGIAAPRDASGECLWYAAGNYKNATKSVPLNWDVPGHFRILDLDAKELAKPDDAFGGAAAVIFAPGVPLAAQNRPAGGGECSGDTTNGFAAYLDAGYVSPLAATVGTPYPITAGREATDTLNNDRVAWITPQEIFSKRVKLRSDFQAGINAMIGSTQACLQATLPTPTAISGLANPADKLVGRVPASCAAPLPTDYYPNYSDQLFYARCPTAGSRCFTVNGTSCDGVLLFSGERDAGQLRLTGAQRDTPGNYLEGANLNYFTGVGTAFTGASLFSAGNAAAVSADTAVCLNQELAFANDIGKLEVVSPTVSGETFAEVNAGARTLTLGDATTVANPGDIGSGDLYACAWFADVRNFGSGLRAYFMADFLKIGEGMTVTIADALKNPDTQRCGSAGQQMGYAAKGAGARDRINFPKIGLEFDTTANNGYNEAAGQELTGRNDDLILAGSPHVGFVFWGNSFANALQGVANKDWDDNVHNKGGATSATLYTDPPNPSGAGLGSGFKKMRGNGTGGIDRYVVRLDIQRVRDTANKRSTYTLKGWTFALGGESCYATAVGAGIADLTDDFENFIFWSSACRTPFSRTITILDEDDNEAFRTFRVGFTTGQSNSGQTVVISGFKLLAIP